MQHCELTMRPEWYGVFDVVSRSTFRRNINFSQTTISPPPLQKLRHELRERTGKAFFYVFLLFLRSSASCRLPYRVLSESRVWWLLGASTGWVPVVIIFIILIGDMSHAKSNNCRKVSWSPILKQRCSRQRGCWKRCLCTPSHHLTKLWLAYKTRTPPCLPRVYYRGSVASNTPLCASSVWASLSWHQPQHLCCLHAARIAGATRPTPGWVCWKLSHLFIILCLM